MFVGPGLGHFVGGRYVSRSIPDDANDTEDLARGSGRKRQFDAHAVPGRQAFSYGTPIS